MAMAFDAFSAFAQSRRLNLRRIATRTCGELTEEDVLGEAWLMAEKIGQRRGTPVDFGNVDDQEHVLACLFNRLVRYADKQIRYAVRLDKGWDQEEAGAVEAALFQFLIAPEASDPAVAFQLFQECEDPLALVCHSYSQAAAYVIMLERFDWELDDLAEHLRIVVGTLRARIQNCAVWIRHQPSLFDRVSTIALDFVPSLSRRRSQAAVEYQGSPWQMAWTEGRWQIPMGE